MRIIDLIDKLQTLYNTYTDEYKATMGEPEIMIDVFEEIGAKDQIGNIQTLYGFEYMGISPNIVIEKSDDGLYDILSKFHEDQDQYLEAEEPVCSSWPFPIGGKP